MKKFADICWAHVRIVVCDEVKVRLARSDRLHCFEHEGFVPDVLVLGKGLGGGLPLSAVIAPSEILDCATGFAMQTLHGNRLRCRRLAVLHRAAPQGSSRSGCRSRNLLHQNRQTVEFGRVL